MTLQPSWNIIITHDYVHPLLSLQNLLKHVQNYNLYHDGLSKYQDEYVKIYKYDSHVK